MTNSRQKGAAFERHVASNLCDLLGIKFKRDLDQYRQRDRGDLIAECDAFPFLIECKARANGGFQKGWWEQAVTAAAETGQDPAVVYKFDHKPIRVRLGLDAVIYSLARETVADDVWIETDLEGFAYITRERLA